MGFIRGHASCFLEPGSLIGLKFGRKAELGEQQTQPKIHLPLPTCTGITSVCLSFFFFFLEHGFVVQTQYLTD